VAGMRALGRVYDKINGPSGIDICLKDASGIGFTAVNGTTTAAILTVVAKPSFGGSAANWSAANGFGIPGKYYTRTANTAAWVEHLVGTEWPTSGNGNVFTVGLTTTGLITEIEFLTSQFADTYDYINVTVSGTGCTLTMATLYDLTVARSPVRLRIPSA
jgi:hypothetical protein